MGKGKKSEMIENLELFNRTLKFFNKALTAKHGLYRIQHVAYMKWREGHGARGMGPGAWDEDIKQRFHGFNHGLARPSTSNLQTQD